ncbi:MAG: hypothetical protein, partial [Olavius algarvensis Gamma 1 endosymbiont]
DSVLRTKRDKCCRRVLFQRSTWFVSPVSFPTGLRVSPCSGCETGHPSPPFALRSGDNLYVPRT